MAAVLFYEKNKAFYEFSNFYGGKTAKNRIKLEIDGRQWLSTEQYFQAQKFHVPGDARSMEYFEIIQSADSPMKTAVLGRQKKCGGYAGRWVVNKVKDERTMNEVIEEYHDVKLREDWDEVKCDVMYKALHAKFTQNEYLKDLLMSTGDKEIIEASPRDAYWGWGKDKKGVNMLGKLLMKLRTELGRP